MRLTISHRASWPSDPALINYLPNRSILSLPQPGQAFGLFFEPGSDLWRQVRNLKHSTIPSVSPICVRNLAFPLLIFESQSNAGNIRAAENQLANAATKALDILCSLDLHRELYVLGIVQVEFSVWFYVCICTRQSQTDEALVDKVLYIIDV